MFSTNHDKRKGKGYDLAIDLEKLRNNIIPGIIPKPNLNVSSAFWEGFPYFSPHFEGDQPAGCSPGILRTHCNLLMSSMDWFPMGLVDPHLPWLTSWTSETFEEQKKVRRLGSLCR